MEPNDAVEARPAFTLRPYQRDALSAIERAERRGLRAQLVVLPTGTGKTVIFSHLIRGRGGRGLILAHREELVAQAVDKLRLTMPGVDVGVVKADRDEVGAAVIVASVQTLARQSRLDRLPVCFTDVIVDEAHHSAAPSYRRIIDHLGAGQAAGPLLVGFTATPDRGDGLGLDRVFDEIVYTRTLPEMIAAGFLADLRAVQVRLDTNFAELHVRAGDFVDSESAALLSAARAPETVATTWRQHAEGRRGLVFTPTVPLAEEMAGALCDVGVSAEALSGSTPADERRAILGRLHDGTTRVVANCAVLTEGFDEPSIDCIVIARPTRSRGLYTQMIGRATRLYPGKADALIIDLVGATARHDLVTLAALAGVEAKAIETEGVTEVLAEKRPGAALGGTWAAELFAHEIDLFRKRPMAWVRSGPNYVLAAGDGFIALEPSNGAWAVLHRPRSGPPRRVASDLPLEWAQGAGEDLVRAMGAAHLAERTAPWRRRPASDKQLVVLRKMRVAAWPGITAGEASDIISERMARAS